MVTVCAWCQKYMGSKEPFHNPGVSHGICDGCYEREARASTPVLVVSRDRSHAVPMLQALLRGTPEVAIVVDRRAAQRRRGDGRGDGHGRPVAYVADRRANERRRDESLFVV